MFKSAGNIKYAAKAYSEAIELGRKALALNPKRSTIHGDNALYQQAQVFAQWGQQEEAFAALAKAHASADSGLVYLLNDPLLDPLRNDPRYKKLLMDLKFV